MARPWGIDYDGAYYHVLSRGNEGRDIFYDDKDRRIFLDALGEMSERFEIEIYAFVFMSDHYHVLARMKTSKAYSDADVKDRLAIYYKDREREIKPGQIPYFRNKFSPRRYASNGKLFQ